MLRVGGAASEAFLARQLGEEEEAADSGGNAVSDGAAVNWHWYYFYVRAPVPTCTEKLTVSVGVCVCAVYIFVCGRGYMFLGDNSTNPYKITLAGF